MYCKYRANGNMTKCPGTISLLFRYYFSSKLCCFSFLFSIVDNDNDGWGLRALQLLWLNSSVDVSKAGAITSSSVDVIAPALLMMFLQSIVSFSLTSPTISG